MKGNVLKDARNRAGWSQARVATALGVTQAYVSLIENSRRPMPDRLARKVARLLDVPATALPVSLPPASHAEKTSEALVDELARLDYPGFAYLRKDRAKQNPAELLVNALALDGIDARLLEALPWLLLRFDELDLESVIRAAKLQNLQNRLGFTVSLAREVAERNRSYDHRLGALRVLEQRLEDSRLAREDTFGRRQTTERMRLWLRDHRSDLAQHWNLLTDLKAEHLPYGNLNTGTLAELPAGG